MKTYLYRTTNPENPRDAYVCVAENSADAIVEFRRRGVPWPMDLKNVIVITSEEMKAEPEGLKRDEGKPRYTLLPWEALREVVSVLEYGAKKYSPNNWQRVDNAKERYTDALFRHLVAWLGGEERDAESGQLHLAHVATNALFLLYFELKG